MKRIIIVGPAASGKDFLKQRLGEKSLKLDVSYTTRHPREGEVHGKDYNFISEKMFFDEGTDFYEYVKFGDYYYGVINKPITHSNDTFIMLNKEHEEILKEWARIQNIDLKTFQVIE